MVVQQLRDGGARRVGEPADGNDPVGPQVESLGEGQVVGGGVVGDGAQGVHEVGVPGLPPRMVRRAGRAGRVLLLELL